MRHSIRQRAKNRFARCGVPFRGAVAFPFDKGLPPGYFASDMPGHILFRIKYLVNEDDGTFDELGVFAHSNLVR